MEDKQEAVEWLVRRVEAVRAEIAKAVSGKADVTDKILMVILAGGHVLLEDVPGTGKTTTALAFSRALGLEFKRVQFTPDVVPSDVTGFTIYEKNGEFRYVPGAAMCNLLLADEINRTSSKTQSALLEVMEERQGTVEGQTRPLPDPFFVIATQNPTGSAGTQQLPESQLDRFMARLSMGYPNREAQIELLANRQTANPLDKVEQVVDSEQLRAMRNCVEQVFVHEAFLGYAPDLTDATRNDERIELGISPRGALALVRMAKAQAAFAGRDWCEPTDIADMLACSCAHRLVLAPRARLDGITQEQVLSDILKTVAPPAPKA